MKLGDGEDTITNDELEESAAEEEKEEEENETDETREDGEYAAEQETESDGEGTEEEGEEGISEGSEGSEEWETTIEVSVDSISMDTNLTSLGFVPVALFCIIFLLGIIALGGD